MVNPDGQGNLATGRALPPLAARRRPSLAVGLGRLPYMAGVAGMAALAMLSPLSATGIAQASASPPGGSWTVYHHDRAGSGAAGPLAQVDTGTRKWTSPRLDGQIYGEPLVFSGRVFVATENNTVYALSAATGKVIWSSHLAAPVPARALPCGNITPTVGITGTPVIDPARHEIFAVADELVHGRPAHVLVGLGTATGARELARNVDPAGAYTPALLQRTGLTLDAGRVVFGFGGNLGDCSSYRGRLVAVPETGGAPSFFTVDAAAGESQGAIWMGGAAPSVDAHGNIWAGVGNGSVTSASHAYDYSDSVLEVSPAMRLRHFFAPVSWASDNASDLDLSTEPALLNSGQVVAAGKSGTAYLLSGTDPGGIGGQRATLHGACRENIDGGNAVSGRTVYLPCLSGIVAVRAAQSPPALRLLWRSGTAGGPPILAAHRVWTIGRDGTLYGLDPATGKIRQRAPVGVPANHFPPPAAAGGILVAAPASDVVAFTTSRTSLPAASDLAGTDPAGPGQPPGGGIGGGAIAVSVAAILLLGALGVLAGRRRAGSR